MSGRCPRNEAGSRCTRPALESELLSFFLRTFGYRAGQDRSTDLCLLSPLGSIPERFCRCRRDRSAVPAGRGGGRPRSSARTSARPPHGKFPLKKAASPAAAAVRVSLRAVRARAGAPRREAGAELSAWPVSSGGAGRGARAAAPGLRALPALPRWSRRVFLHSARPNRRFG